MLCWRYNGGQDQFSSLMNFPTMTLAARVPVVINHTGVMLKEFNLLI